MDPLAVVPSAAPPSTASSPSAASTMGDDDAGSDAGAGLKREDDDDDPPVPMEDIAVARPPPPPLETKRKRGRPKKTPASPAGDAAKVAKGSRSKTGCFTCRRRKKKCDETKPSCVACQKNNVECEGYPPKVYWMGGKQRPDEAEWPPAHAAAAPKLAMARIPRGLPFLIDGIETSVDRRFLHHFIHDLSRVLTLHDNRSNPFKDLLLPMAKEHKGLMHSLMALSGSHLVARQPSLEFRARQQHHAGHAISILRAEMEAAAARDLACEAPAIEDPVVASTIVQCLICISDGATHGEHQMHLDGAATLINRRRSDNADFQKFIYEFFMYHEVSSAVTSLQRRGSLPLPLPGPDDADGPAAAPDDGAADDGDDDDDDGPGRLPRFVIEPVMHPAAGGFMVGVLDGLFRFISKITLLRDTIRERMARRLSPMVPYAGLQEAIEIDDGIRDWDCGQERLTARWVLAQLYRQCTWVYLYRTIKASRPSPTVGQAVDDALEFLRALPPDDSTQCILLLPAFILGCAAFHERQRPDIERAFDNLLRYSNLGNIRPARLVVHRVWEMMDAGDERSWDWETIMADMGIDLLVT
jgi:hypothetical protein